MRKYMFAMMAAVIVLLSAALIGVAAQPRNRATVPTPPRDNSVVVETRTLKDETGEKFGVQISSAAGTVWLLDVDGFKAAVAMPR